MTDLRLPNPFLLEQLGLFAVGLPDSMANFDPAPFGVTMASRIHPLRSQSAPFLDLLKQLDEQTFGALGMPMPRWVYLVGAELTGALVGLGQPADQASDQARELLQVPKDYTGIVPYSVFMALPTAQPGEWMAHNLASLANRITDRPLAGLGGLTKSLALKMFGASAQLGATQWDSVALFVHTRLGALELLTADTPAHSPGTLTYRVAVDDNALRNLARDQQAAVDHPRPSEWLTSSDSASIERLQQRIESGEKLCIAGRPRPAGDGLEVPLGRPAVGFE